MPQLQRDNGLQTSIGPDSPSRAAPSLASAGIAHELGNLIQIASSAVNIIARRAATDQVLALEPVISGAKASLDRAGTLVRQSLGRAPPTISEIEHFDVATAMAEIQSLVQPTWAPRHRIDIKYAAGLPAMKCHRMALQGALLNLALNARDSMLDGGVVAIEALRAPIDLSDAFIELTVTDTGIGMTPDTVQRALDPFFTTKSGGLGGIGLSMVKHFVEEAGGQITLSSTLGEGTTVSLLLPAVR